MHIKGNHIYKYTTYHIYNSNLHTYTLYTYTHMYMYIYILYTKWRKNICKHITHENSAKSGAPILR